MAMPYYIECLRRELSHRSQYNPRYSLRAFARSLHLPASTLSRALAGKRTLSLAAAKSVVTRLDLSPREKNLFFASLGAQSRKAALPDSEASSCEVQGLEEENFKVVAEWQHFAILEMTYLKNFRADPIWIASRLGISSLEASSSLRRLEEVGLLKRVGGKLVKSSRTIWASADGRTTAALRLHQKQSLGRAIEAIDNIPFERRTSSVMTMPIDAKRLPLARRLIEEFAVDLCRSLSSKSVSDVYQLTISFHSLLRGETT